MKLVRPLISLQCHEPPECVVGEDLVAYLEGWTVTLYRRRGQMLEILGIADGAAAAFALLDLHDLG